MAVKDENPAKTDAEKVEAEKVDHAAQAEGLVKVKKDGKTLHIHPSTVESHKEAGWKVA